MFICIVEQNLFEREYRIYTILSVWDKCPSKKGYLCTRTLNSIHFVSSKSRTHHRIMVPYTVNNIAQHHSPSSFNTEELYQILCWSKEVWFLLCGQNCAVSIQLPSVCRAAKRKFQVVKKYFRRPNSAA